MAKPRAKSAPKRPKGPHALSRAGEARETKAQERAESPAFEAMEKRLGIEKPRGKKGKRR